MQEFKKGQKKGNFLQKSLKTHKMHNHKKKLKNTQNVQFSNARNLYIAVLKSLLLTLFNVISRYLTLHWSSLQWLHRQLRTM
jgi:hypothetical protein